MLDIKEYLQDKFGEIIPATYPLVRINCPFCADSKQRLYIAYEEADKPRGWMFCHNEQIKYDFVEMYVMLENISWQNAREIIYGVNTEPKYARIDDLFKIIKIDPTDKKVNEINEYEEIKLPKFFTPMYGLDEKTFEQKTNDYLRSRKVDKKLCDDNFLGISKKTMSGEWANRLIIPIFQDGKLVAYQGRAMYAAKERKYVFNKKAKIGNYLYNIDNISMDAEYVILVEGVFDVWAIKTAGFNNVVASFGKHLTDKCLATIIKRFKYVYILWDSDAKSEICDIVDKFYDKIKIYICNLDKKDPAESTKLEIIKCFMEAREYDKDYKIEAKLKYKLK